MVFSRDAIHNVGFRADWNYIKQRKQRLIEQNNKRENAKRTPYTYHVGEQVKILQDPQCKFGQNQYIGPYEVVEVCDNGTVRLRRDTAHGGAVTEQWNIRNILPYKD